MNDAEGPLTVSPPRPALPEQAVRLLGRRAERVRQQVLAAPLPRRPDDAAAEAVTVGDDLRVWLAAFTEHLSAAEVTARFEERAEAHATAGLRCEDALIQQHVCAAALTEAVADSADREAVGRLVLDTLGSATTAIVRRYRAVPPGPRPAPEPELARLRAAAPRWCLAATQLGRDGKEALRRFRAANPEALVAVTGAHLTAFTYERPRGPEVFGPYGLVYVEDGQTVRAARRAALASVVARHYGVHVDTEQAMPLIAALDMPADQREAFVASCLGPLHTSDRYRHLIATLSAYLAHNLCVSAAARALYVHRHTMTYRLQTISELTGLELANPFDRMRAELALVLSQAPTWSVPRARRR